MDCCTWYDGDCLVTRNDEGMGWFGRKFYAEKNSQEHVHYHSIIDNKTTMNTITKIPQLALWKEPKPDLMSIAEDKNPNLYKILRVLIPQWYVWDIEENFKHTYTHAHTQPLHGVIYKKLPTNNKQITNQLRCCIRYWQEALITCYNRLHSIINLSPSNKTKKKKWILTG